MTTPAKPHSERQTVQDARSVEQNKSFFAGNDAYAASVAELDTYRNIRAAIDAQIRGRRRLLDIGNGGVFDYDTSLAGEIVGVDLFLDGTEVAGLPGNVTLRQGDALALAEDDAAYDGVLFALVFHHLTGRNTEETVANMRRAVDEAYRVLEPGGRLLVVESCVPERAYSVERVLFKPLTLLTNTRLMSHPPTLQVPPRTITGFIEERFGGVTVERIPTGRWILQFGWRWPTALTPARPYMITAVKPG
jgi:ubiquinone/menaquinone biosynthesis C-methylase UbiE